MKFREVSSLYRLDQIKVAAGDSDAADAANETEMQETTGWNDLPAESKALLIILPCIWIVIGVIGLIRSKKTKQKN